MRNLLMAGTAGLLLALGAVGAANADNPNVPSYSPYAIMGPGAASSPMPWVVVTEGRSAYVEADQGYGADLNGSQYTAPEDRNYYSRGR